MGRLFWKLFFGFWLTLLLTGLTVALAVNVLRDTASTEDAPAIAGGPAAAMLVDSGAAVLHHGGVEALREFIRAGDGRPRTTRLHAIDTLGNEVLDRSVAAEAQEAAQIAAQTERRRQAARWVEAPRGERYLLFVPPSETRPTVNRHRSQPLFPPALLMLFIGVAASVVFAALLAWYLSRPIRHLRSAFDSAAQGQLDVRVRDRIGRRRDEIADLGRDFDRMAQRLQQLLEGQQRLLHDVSHELRSPLARMQAAVGLARQNPARTGDMLTRLEHETARLDQLVGELLTLSRLDTATGQAEAEEIDVMEMLEAIVADARFEAQSTARDVQCRRSGECVGRYHVDALQRGIENIVRNAVKYTAPGTTVEVIAHRVPAQNLLRIEVCDRGPGVAESELQRIFEPFHRSESSTGVSGFGLGLAIAKRAIETNGGALRASNREGGGLCVGIALPCNA